MERLTEQEVRDIILSSISVDPQKIAVMKGLLLKHVNTTTATMIEAAVKELGFDGVERVMLGRDTRILENVGAYFSWTLSAVEAVWGLIHSGILLPAHSQELVPITKKVTIRTVTSSSEEYFSDFSTLYPKAIIKTRCRTDSFILSDPDLYLEALRPHVVHSEVAEALQESVRCFRAELFMASVVMLGKASEGIWIELGTALIDALPKAEQGKSAKFRSDLESVNVGFAKKLRDIMKHYESKQAEYAVVAKDSGLTLEEVRFSCLWSESVRDSRNVVHYGTKPSVPHNYQNVATLLLTGSTHLRNLHALYASARAHRGA